MEKRIYYHDTDAGGVVYYGTYLNYLEEARTEFMINKGLLITELHKDGFLYAVRKCNVTYKSPVRYGDTIVCTSEIKKVTAAQFIFDQKIYEKESNRLVLEAEVTLVSLDQDFKPTPIPEGIRSRLS